MNKEEQAVINPDAEFNSELALMASWIDQIGIDNTSVTRGAAKIKIGSAMKRLSAKAAPKGDDVKSKEGNTDEIIDVLMENRKMRKLLAYITGCPIYASVTDFEKYASQFVAPQAVKWVQASEEKPKRQVAARRNGFYGILLPLFEQAYEFITTDFFDIVKEDVTDTLHNIEWLDEGSTDKNETQPSFSLNDMLECWHQAMFCGGKESYFKEKFGITV